MNFKTFGGTYVHPLLVNYVCQWANKAYAVKVSIMMNLINEEAKLKYECSCSIDISKFISTHYTDVYCKFYHRKIIFAKGENENILKDISKYINKTLNGKISIIERLDDLDTKMEEYRIELKENAVCVLSSLSETISYLAKLITGNKYVYKGRYRTLYETGKGKYFNINRKRDYLSEEQAKNILK